MHGVAYGRSAVVSYEDLKVMSEGAAIMLAYLRHEIDCAIAQAHGTIDRPNTPHLTKEDVEEAEYILESKWVPFSMEKIAYDIGMSSWRQSKYLRELAHIGKIECVREGFPAKRWVRWKTGSRQKKQKARV